MIDLFDNLRELLLVCSHLFALFDTLFVIVENVGDRYRAGQIEEQEIGESSGGHNLESAVRRREERQDALDARV